MIRLLLTAIVRQKTTAWREIEKIVLSSLSWHKQQPPLQQPPLHHPHTHMQLRVHYINSERVCVERQKSGYFCHPWKNMPHNPSPGEFHFWIQPSPGSFERGGDLSLSWCSRHWGGLSTLVPHTTLTLRSALFCAVLSLLCCPCVCEIMCVCLAGRQHQFHLHAKLICRRFESLLCLFDKHTHTLTYELDFRMLRWLISGFQQTLSHSSGQWTTFGQIMGVREISRDAVAGARLPHTWKADLHKSGLIRKQLRETLTWLVTPCIRMSCRWTLAVVLLQLNSHFFHWVAEEAINLGRRIRICCRFTRTGRKPGVSLQAKKKTKLKPWWMAIQTKEDRQNSSPLLNHSC